LYYHYNPNKINVNIQTRLYQCLERLMLNVSKICKIGSQFESFKDTKGLFNIDAVKATKNKIKIQLNGEMFLEMNVRAHHAIIN